MVKRGDADVAALPVGEERIKEAGLQPAGVNDAKLHTSWAVRSHAEDLAEALRAWFTSNTLAEVQAGEKKRLREVHEVRRHMQAVFLSRDRGIILSTIPCSNKLRLRRDGIGNSLRRNAIRRVVSILTRDLGPERAVSCSSCRERQQTSA